MKKLLLLTVSGSLLFCLPACDKQKYRGPRGATGAQGPQGPIGPAGKDAEVTNSGGIEVPYSQWTNDGTEWRATISTDLITGEVIERGSVQVLLKIVNIWHTLPYFEQSEFITFAYEPGKLYLIKADSHGSLPEQPETAIYKFTVILDSDRLSKNNRFSSYNEEPGAVR